MGIFHEHSLGVCLRRAIGYHVVGGIHQFTHFCARLLNDCQCHHSTDWRIAPAQIAIIEARDQAFDFEYLSKICVSIDIARQPPTDIGDYQIKLRNMLRLLQEGNIVEITLRFRGPEITHQDADRAVLKRAETDRWNMARPKNFQEWKAIGS